MKLFFSFLIVAFGFIAVSYHFANEEECDKALDDFYHCRANGGEEVECSLVVKVENQCNHRVSDKDLHL